MHGRSRLALTHTRLAQWRAQHGGRGIPMPEELWAEVVKVARVEGAGTTARGASAAPRSSMGRARSRLVRWLAGRHLVDGEQAQGLELRQLAQQQRSLPCPYRELVPTSVPTFPWRRETPGYALKRSTYWNQ